MISGVLSGIVGGIVVGFLSRSQTSVSGPAAGLTAVVAGAIQTLGSFPAFLAAVFLAGIIQVGMGFAQAGFIAAFFPSSVIKGLLAAIGVILILKQIPHVAGHDPDPVGEMTFAQPDGQNTITELFATLSDVQPGATLIGLVSIALLVLWARIPRLKKSLFPGPLAVVLLGVAMNELFLRIGSSWAISQSHLVQLPVARNPQELLDFFHSPDWSQLLRPAVWSVALTLAVVASLETLLNLQAVDDLDPAGRHSDPNRELLAQGVGNMLAGTLGALPVTSVIVRSSVNIGAGARSQLSTITHGFLLLFALALAPTMMNRIPLSCLAAVLIVTGAKLADPELFRRMWREGWRQFLPFFITVVAIVLTDLLVGILIGLGISIVFILQSNFRRPLRLVREKHLGGEVLRIELANQVSFLNRANLDKVLGEVPAMGHVLFDARSTDYIDPDVLDLLEDFRERIAPARGIRVSQLGLRDHYQQARDEILYVDFSTRELRENLTPQQVLEILRDGNQRFRSGHQLTRDFRRQVTATAGSPTPLAVAFSCMDSRTPVEIVFDLGIGDIFSVRIAGNVARAKVLASLEYSCAVAGAKLILVMGHTSCGAVRSTVDFLSHGRTAKEETGCDHLDDLVREIGRSVEPSEREVARDPAAQAAFAELVGRRNVLRVMRQIPAESLALRKLVDAGAVAIVGGIYDVTSSTVEFFDATGNGIVPAGTHSST